MSKQGEMFLLVNSLRADQSRRSFYLVSYKSETSSRTSDVKNMKKDKHSYWINHFALIDGTMVYHVAKTLCLGEFKILYQNNKTIIKNYVIYKLTSLLPQFY